MTRIRREVRIPVYWVLVGVMVMLVSPFLSIYASVKINQRTLEQNERSKVAARVESIAVYCRLLGTQVDVYSEATSPVGMNAYTTWITEYRRQGCLPRR